LVLDSSQPCVPNAKDASEEEYLDFDVVANVMMNLKLGKSISSEISITPGSLLRSGDLVVLSSK